MAGKMCGHAGHAAKRKLRTHFSLCHSLYRPVTQTTAVLRLTFQPITSAKSVKVPFENPGAASRPETGSTLSERTGRERLAGTIRQSVHVRYDMSYRSHCILAFERMIGADKSLSGPSEMAPRQRPCATVDALFEATAHILKDGYEQASTNRIAHAASANIGSPYQYFPSREAFIFFRPPC